MFYLLAGAGSTAMTRALFTVAWSNLVTSSLSLSARR